MSEETEAQETPVAGTPPIPEPAATSDTTAVSAVDEKATNTWAMFLHFSLLAGGLIPGAGLIVPIILWQLKKNEMPIIDEHGKIVVNWIISLVIYGVVCLILTLALVGIFGFIALGLMSVIYAIVGGIKANNGEVWNYPGSLKLIK
ncbi:MAG: DUF4870 domain-containing protein [Kiritimatiellae bacterium]|nr:DUF4870 domain-containing protein [Kiritimatiellia bacterium]